MTPHALPSPDDSTPASAERMGRYRATALEERDAHLPNRLVEDRHHALHGRSDGWGDEMGEEHRCSAGPEPGTRRLDG